jgi:tetratricopeptide (TPR) repeat protein
MVSTRFVRSLCCSSVVALAVLTALGAADERYLDFVHRLQERGYGEISIQYLDRLNALPDPPDEVREVWELEMGKSLRIAADEAPNADQTQKRLADALAHIDKFLKENADHPAAAEALAALGDISMQRGQLLIKSARNATDKTKQGELFTNARAAFEESRPRFVQSVERYQSYLRELLPAAPETPKKDTTKKATTKAITKRPPRPTSKAARDAAAERQETEMNWLDARLKLALVDYYVAQTYSDPKDAARIKSFEQAAVGFDGIFQQYRTYEIGLYAHMWEGKSRDELGDLKTAEAIYDEVLVNAPESGQPQAATTLDPLFAQVEMFRLQLLLKKGDVNGFTEAAAAWLRFHQQARRTAGYQGIALELAKTQIAQAEKAAADERRRLFTAALRSLSDITKVQSEYQQEAILLRRKYQEEVKGSTSEIVSLDEGLTVGNSAARSGQWEEAVAAYGRAAEFAAKDKDPERLVDARFRLAHAQFMAGKVAEAADTAEEIARKNLASRTAPQAAALATSAALALYSTAQDKAPALDRLMKMANYTIDHWPDRPEADDARIALGQSNLVRGDLDAAITVFEQIKPGSERYASALHNAGYAYWRSYVANKQKTELLDKAKAAIGASLEAQKKALKTGDTPTRQILDSQLLMAEILLETNQADEAVVLLDPLIETIRSAKLEGLDSTTLRTLVAGLRGYIAVGNLTKAGEVQAIVGQIGSDSPQVNAVLVEFAKLLAKDAVGDTKTAESAQAAQKGMHEVFIRLLDQLAQRKQHSLANMIYIADSYARAGVPEKAREQYQRIIKAAEEDPSLQSGNAAIVRVRAQLVGLLRNEGQFEEAMKQVDQLLKANPRDLAPMMEKGHILQAWAEKDPKRYGDAIGHWSGLRTTLSRMQRKPPEYYDVVYNAAACLVAQAKQTQDKSKALQAEQLIKSSLVLSPNLNGPETVAKYNELLQEAMKFQGR